MKTRDFMHVEGDIASDGSEKCRIRLDMELPFEAIVAISRVVQMARHERAVGKSDEGNCCRWQGTYRSGDGGAVEGLPGC